jgi:hypothetical protein
MLVRDTGHSLREILLLLRLGNASAAMRITATAIMDVFVEDGVVEAGG